MPKAAKKWLRRNVMNAFQDTLGLADIQRLFSHAIFSDVSPISAFLKSRSLSTTASRFGVYRNNVIGGLMNAVTAKYPVVRKLLGDDSFHGVVRLYVTAEPPKSPILLEYGKSFPQFIRSVGHGAAAEYLATIAELEAARVRAYHAADAKPIGKSAFASLSPDQLAELTINLHPSVVLLNSRFPFVSIWESNYYGDTNDIQKWAPESALIARPYLQVVVWRLSDGDYEFLNALSQGRTVASAIECAVATAANFDLAASLTTLISSEIVIGFGWSNRPAVAAQTGSKP